MNGSNPTLSATGFTWDGTTIPSVPVDPGYYDLEVTMGGPLVDAGDTHVIVMQGLTFNGFGPNDPQVHASQAFPVSLTFDTATIGTLAVSFYVAQGATQTPIHQSTISGELHSVLRQLTWNATDATGAAIADGTYTLGATITDQASGLMYTATAGDVIVP
jgi:hypothetical protein